LIILLLGVFVFLKKKELRWEKEQPLKKVNQYPRNLRAKEELLWVIKMVKILRGKIKCAFCNGTGDLPGTPYMDIKCPVCRGEGFVNLGKAIECAYCGGKGRKTAHYNVTCSVCKGLGAVEVKGTFKICPDCKAKTELMPDNRNNIEASLEGLSPESFYKGVKENKDMTVYKGKGCIKCGNTGYKGRLAIAEVLYIGHQMREIISKGFPSAEVKEELKRQKFISITQDGWMKVLLGETTVEEVLRVTKIE